MIQEKLLSGDHMSKIINYLLHFGNNNYTRFPGLFKRTNQPMSLEYAIIRANHGVLFEFYDESSTLDWKRL